MHWSCYNSLHWSKLYFHGPLPILGQLCFPDCAGTILLDFLPKSSSSFKAFKRPLSKTFLLKQEPLEKWTEHSILFISLLGGLEKNYVSKTHCILIEFYKNNWVCYSYTPPIAEILCVKNGRAIMVCGFLIK